MAKEKIESKEKREEMINDIVLECDGSWDYRDFLADCFRQTVSQWTDEEINNWFGIEEEDNE